MAFGWYDFGALFYDPRIGRWHTPDPLEQYESGYVYEGNNPILMNDPWGMWAEQSKYAIASFFLDKNDKVTWRIDDGDNKLYRVSEKNHGLKVVEKKIV